ncbi:MAG TPA: M56 family metallopeptidase [Acidobacteriaceae bacterium]|jgi:beta-lactamase regulating signal transducer with metallopeptidase domain|nr:M56 family metallopeptidase [Acidobacteriaceae bacterium]
MTHINFAMTTLLNGICEGTLLAAAMWLFLKLLPRLNSTTRFTVLWVTLLAVLALPLEPLILPVVGPLTGPLTSRVFNRGARMDSPAIAVSNTPTAKPSAHVEVPEPRFNLRNSSAVSTSHLASIPKPEPVAISKPASESVQARNTVSRSISAVMAAIEHPMIHIRSGRILGAFEIMWALLSLVMLARLGFGYWVLRGWKADTMPASPEWQLRLRSLSGINGVRRQTQLLVSSHIAAPMSLGFLNPAILIPRALLDTLSDSELEHVVLHELAHLHRRDDWTNLAEKLLHAILPIHPAVYWIGHRMSIEREMACDDWVIAATGMATPYAASLTRVAELSQWSRAGILAAGATGNRSQLFSRVHHMLDRTRNAAPKLAFGPLGAAIAAAGILIYAGTQAPQMIAFAENPAHENSKQEMIPPSAPHSAQALQASTSTAVSSAPLPFLSTPIAALEPTATALSSDLPLESPVLQASSELPALAMPPAAIAPAGAQQSSETHMEMTTRNGLTSLSVKIDGAVEFTDDDRDVKSLSPGGHFRMEEGTWLSGRAYDVKADSAGNLTKTYSVGWSAKPLDSEGRVWLEHLLPQMIRDSGIGAGPRVARILRQGGPQAVITEIELIHSDGSKRVYVEQLFSQATLNTEQMKEAARLIRGISSDGDKAQVLVTVDGKYFTGDLRPNLFEAVESIGSDGDKRRVLSDILKKDAGSADTLLSVARTAKHISSDGDKAEVMIEMAEPYHPNDGLGMAYFDAVKSISSDGDHARVLLTLLAAHGDDRDTLARVLQSAGKISSDGDKARVLKEAVARYSDDALIRKAFFDAANSISSDGDHQQVLVALVHRQGIAAATLGGIANSAQRISSDGDKAHVLVELAGVNIEPVRDDFFAAANTINSDGDHSHVLLALLDKPGTSTTTTIAAIQSATRISSDGDKGRVLLDVADRYSKDPAVDSALRKAIESVHSDGVYRSIMSEIMRHSGNS